MALYLFETPEEKRRPSGWKVVSLNVGDTLEESPINCFNTLRPLVEKYNALQALSDMPMTPDWINQQITRTLEALSIVNREIQMLR